MRIVYDSNIILKTFFIALCRKFHFSVFFWMFSFSTLFSQTDDLCTLLEWDNQLQITHTGCLSYVPEMISTGNTVHLIWFGFPSPPYDTTCTGVLYSRSTDGGETFSEPLQLLTYEGAYGNQGRIAAAGDFVYILHAVRAPAPAYSNIGLLRSSNAGESWESLIIPSDAWPRSIAARNSEVFIYFANTYAPGQLYTGVMRSQDYGNTWDTLAIGLPPVLNSSVRKMSVSAAGIHIAYNYGGHFSIETMYIRSTDFGMTWSQPETLSTDDYWHSHSSDIATDDSGRIYVTWNDGKYGGDFSGTIILRRSTDNGETWLPEQIISEDGVAVFHKIDVKDSTVGIVWEVDSSSTWTIESRMSIDHGESWCDITNISRLARRTGDPWISISDSNIHYAWDNDSSNLSQIYYRRSHRTLTSVANYEQIPREIKLYQSYPNPFNSQTIIRFDLSESDFVDLRVYDIVGREVSKLVEERRFPGHYTESWNAGGFPSGVYYYRLHTKHSILTRAMVLMK